MTVSTELEVYYQVHDLCIVDIHWIHALLTHVNSRIAFCLFIYLLIYLTIIYLFDIYAYSQSCIYLFMWCSFELS